MPVDRSLQHGTVILDRFVQGSEGEGGHFDWVRTSYGRVEFNCDATFAGQQVMAWAGLQVKGRHRYLANDLSLHLVCELLPSTPQLVVWFSESVTLILTEGE